MSDNILLFRDNEQIVSLWCEAFGDSKEEVLFFLENCKNKECVALCDDDNILKSMLFLVDCKINNEAYKYIYAASTFKKLMGMGYMTSILNYCKNNYGNLCLIAGNESLVSFYLERGFDDRASLNEILFNECDEIKEYLFEGSSLKEPYIMLNKGEK